MSTRSLLEEIVLMKQRRLTSSETKRSMEPMAKFPDLGSCLWLGLQLVLGFTVGIKATCANLSLPCCSFSLYCVHTRAYAHVMAVVLYQESMWRPGGSRPEQNF